MAGRIVVPLDFGIDSEIAVRTAINLVGRSKSELHLVTCLDSAASPDDHRAAQQRLDAIDGIPSEMTDSVFRHVLNGKPCESIVDYADKCRAEFIVMGAHGGSSMLNLALGSVALRVLKMAPCPVVIANSLKERDGYISYAAGVKNGALANSESPAVELIHRAVALRATDIHIDPWLESQFRVRFRIDGRLASYCTMDRGVAAHLINQFMTLAKVDLADPFRPREGRVELPNSLRDVEIRITAAPVAGGESIALRIFSRSDVFLTLDRLGLSHSGLTTVQKILSGKEGLVLVTGPTGSGKTTTVYSMLESFKSNECNVVSIEDPIEFSVPFVRQMGVDEKHGISMTSGLRTLLRMDPDVVFIGEIRDPEAAAIALRAAGAGHFVFSSLHTRDVAASVSVLRDLEIDLHSLSGNLSGIVNQRLVRKLCTHCRNPVAPTAELAQRFAENGLSVPNEIYEAVGCEACRGTGYLGRTGVFEIAACGSEFCEAILAGKSEGELRSLLREQGSPSLLQEALAKVSDGVTSAAEALSVRWI